MNDWEDRLSGIKILDALTAEEWREIAETSARLYEAFEAADERPSGQRLAAKERAREQARSYLEAAMRKCRPIKVVQ